MTTQGKYKLLFLIVLVNFIVFISAAMLAGCKKEPTETPETQTPQRTSQPQALENTTQTSSDSMTDLLPGPKVSLSEVIRSARTWRPAFENWTGKLAPDFTISDLSGNPHTLSSYKGKNVMIIFWATWCGPCRIEIPDLIKLRSTMGTEKLAMLAVSRENPALLRSFVSQQKINYTVVVQSDRLPNPYAEVNAIPCSFFIDPQGKIKLATVGLLSISDTKAILQAE